MGSSARDHIRRREGDPHRFCSRPDAFERIDEVSTARGDDDASASISDAQLTPRASLDALWPRRGSRGRPGTEPSTSSWGSLLGATASYRPLFARPLPTTLPLLFPGLAYEKRQPVARSRERPASVGRRRGASVEKLPMCNRREAVEAEPRDARESAARSSRGSLHRPSRTWRFATKAFAEAGRTAPKPLVLASVKELEANVASSVERAGGVFSGPHRIRVRGRVPRGALAPRAGHRAAIVPRGDRRGRCRVAHGRPRVGATACAPTCAPTCAMVRTARRSFVASRALDA